MHYDFYTSKQQILIYIKLELYNLITATIIYTTLNNTLNDITIHYYKKDVIKHCIFEELKNLPKNVKCLCEHSP